MIDKGIEKTYDARWIERFTVKLKSHNREEMEMERSQQAWIVVRKGSHKCPQCPEDAPMHTEGIAQGCGQFVSCFECFRKMFWAISTRFILVHPDLKKIFELVSVGEPHLEELLTDGCETHFLTSALIFIDARLRERLNNFSTDCTREQELEEEELRLTQDLEGVREKLDKEREVREVARGLLLGRASSPEDSSGLSEEGDSSGWSPGDEDHCGHHPA